MIIGEVGGPYFCRELVLDAYPVPKTITNVLLKIISNNFMLKT